MLWSREQQQCLARVEQDPLGLAVPRLQHHLDAAVLLVIEHLVAVGSPLQRQLMRDHLRGGCITSGQELVQGPLTPLPPTHHLA